MQDAEYQAYLKKQSYEDLLSISHSLDKLSHPDRHAMVIAEIEAYATRPAMEEDAIIASQTSPLQKSSAVDWCFGVLFVVMGLLLLLYNGFYGGFELWPKRGAGCSSIWRWQDLCIDLIIMVMGIWGLLIAFKKGKIKRQNQKLSNRSTGTNQ